MRKKVITGSIILLFFSIFLLIPGCDDFSLVEIMSNNISIIPGEITLNLNESVNFQVAAGIPPYTFTEIGDGTINSGLYTAPGVAGSFTVFVKDDKNRNAESNITVVDVVNIVPEIVTTGINGEIQFTISGGTAPYNVTLDPVLGSDDHPGDGTLLFTYTAGGAAGQETLIITDNDGLTAVAFVSIVSSTELMIVPDIVEVVKTDVFAFSASGGTGPGTYTYSIISGGGSIDAGNGRYTAPGVEGTAVVRVTDATPDTAEATVIIVPNY